MFDKIEFGLNPGDELEVKKTICDDIRKSGQAIIIDEVGADPRWNRHPVPILYGFQSYVSIPIMLDDGRFYGTLFAIDPKPRALGAADGAATDESAAAAPPAPDPDAAPLLLAAGASSVRRGGKLCGRSGAWT